MQGQVSDDTYETDYAYRNHRLLSHLGHNFNILSCRSELRI